MKILILTSRFGMGHYCAAEAIKEEILKSSPNDTIEIVDIVEFLFPMIHKVVYKVFNSFICRFSTVYNFINDFATKHEKDSLERDSLKKMNFLIEGYNPDLIIATWSACSRYVSAYKELYGKSIPLYTYITDITAHDGWITDKTDTYFVATTSTKESLLLKGISEEKIIVNGIPVRQSFKDKLQFKPIYDNNRLSNDSSEICKALDKSLHEKKKIIIMGGGLGLIPDLDNILGELYESRKVHITVITGKNKKLFKRLKKDYPKIDVIGYTNEVDKYMKNSDLLITKPGGISTFEAIHTTTPLYVIKPFLSQEVGNAKFIEKTFIGKIAWESGFDICEDIISLLSNDEVLSEMKYNMRALREELCESRLREVYERDVKRSVDYDIDEHHSISFDHIWSPSYGVLQKVE